MNNSSNESGTSHSTMTTLDDYLSQGSFADNSIGGDYTSRTATTSISSDTSSNTTISLPNGLARNNNDQPYNGMNGSIDRSISQNHYENFKIFDYKQRKFIDYEYTQDLCAEEICIAFCKKLEILPTARLLFGLRIFESDTEWSVPGRPLRSGQSYCFRLRFKVPALDIQLQTLDRNAYEYLYWQMRYDMVADLIPEIHYPAKKDNIMGLGVLDMYIDSVESRDTIENIKKNCKNYLPNSLVKAHRLFVKPKIWAQFNRFRSNKFDLGRVKWNYIHTIHDLAPNYLLEMYTGVVDYIPDEDGKPTEIPQTIDSHDTEMHVYIKLESHDTQEPGIKISRMLSKDKLKWVLVTKLDDIYTVSTEGSTCLRLEITGFPNGFRIQFPNNKTAMESFITYLGGYVRLASKWMFDLCAQFLTPSLQELKNLNCHGPIGGNFSIGIIREKNNNDGSYIVRQSEKEYETYYIDINIEIIIDNKKKGQIPEKKIKTETFKILKPDNASIWSLYYDGAWISFENLNDLALHIKTNGNKRFQIRPSEYDKPPLLLICLPKNFQSKKSTAEISEIDLQRRRVQIFEPKIDLQYYENSYRKCVDDRMFKMRADWIQENGSFKDVSVTLKVLKSDSDFLEFMKLANKWSKIYSPLFIKLYGLTLSSPYTMVMEHSKFGPLNEFLRNTKVKPSLLCLLDVILRLARGVAHLKHNGIIHGYIRCSNLYVTKYDPSLQLIEAKIADPGFPRPYTNEELPWIPFEYHRNLNAAKQDIYADHWAFATTVWEILSMGKCIKNYTAEQLQKNYNTYGGILPQECHECLYKIMMDGWRKDKPDKRFYQVEIFSILTNIREKLSSDYSRLSNTSSLDLNAIIEDAIIDSNGSYSQMSDNSRTHLIPCNERFDQRLSQQKCFPSIQSVLELPGGNVYYQKKIGEGHYGTVYLGHIRYNNEPPVQVAVKTLKVIGKKHELNMDFMREIKIMESLDHPNIVKIKHWVKDPLSIIMEYLESGSFQIYLTTNKHHLTNEKLLCFALDIANGMNYLRERQIIHRDLAARNILVDRDRVKISDFGLAQAADSNGYYIAQSHRDIPIKWYSPESIRTEKYTYQSDVWSYGVTLFEMFSRGEQPDLTPLKEATTNDPSNSIKEPIQNEFLNRLERGERLHQPQQCPDIIYQKLMMRCWHSNPKKRPTFKDIVEMLPSIMNDCGLAC